MRLIPPSRGARRRTGTAASSAAVSSAALRVGEAAVVGAGDRERVSLGDVHVQRELAVLAEVRRFVPAPVCAVNSLSVTVNGLFVRRHRYVRAAAAQPEPFATATSMTIWSSSSALNETDADFRKQRFGLRLGSRNQND